MALAWKAGWVNALAGSNPASSAICLRCRAPVLVDEMSCLGFVPLLVVEQRLKGAYDETTALAVRRTGAQLACLPELCRGAHSVVRPNPFQSSTTRPTPIAGISGTSAQTQGWLKPGW